MRLLCASLSKMFEVENSASKAELERSEPGSLLKDLENEVAILLEERELEMVEREYNMREYNMREY